MEVRRLGSMSELYHHGIKGQEWGVQNGPPYPLNSGSSSSKKKKKFGSKKAKDTIDTSKELSPEDKEKVIRSGNVKLVKSASPQLTNNELERAIKRIELNEKLSDYSITGSKSKVAKKGMNYVKNEDNLMKAVKSTGEAVLTVRKVMGKTN